MSDPDPIAVEACRQFAAEISGQRDAKSFILFGSRARGDYNEESDADRKSVV